MQRRKLIVLDTSVLCTLLGVQGFGTSGPDQHTREELQGLLDAEIKAGAALVLPLAAIIETGNHIANSTAGRYDAAGRLAEMIKATLDGESPWIAFAEQSDLWVGEALQRLIDEWPTNANAGRSMGDLMIVDVAEHYAQAGIWDVVIFTGDEGLRAYSPTVPPPVPRRRET